MKNIFLIERSPDVFHTVEYYLKEGSLSYTSFQTPDEAVLAEGLPALIILFGSNNLQEIRDDVGILKNNPAFARIPKMLILPFESSVTEAQCKPLDVQAILSIPVQKLQFQTLVSKFLNRAPRRVFRILVSIQQDGSKVRYSGISIDFSESGMAFECVTEFQVGENLLLSFVNPRTRSRFSLKTEVIRKTSTPTGSSVFYGVMFRQLSSKEIHELTAFITGAS
jgi:hypothetical protein